MTTASGHTSAIRAKKVIGTTVKNSAGEKIGQVEDIVGQVVPVRATGHRQHQPLVILPGDVKPGYDVGCIDRADASGKDGGIRLQRCIARP